MIIIPCIPREAHWAQPPVKGKFRGQNKMSEHLQKIYRKGREGREEK